MATHAERRVLPYSPKQMYDLVADVEHYPEFLPWCRAARVTSRSDQIIEADLVIGFKMFRERFTSRVTLNPPHEIRVDYVRGPLRRLNNLWRFEPHEDGCMIDFHVDLEFRSVILQHAIGVLFNEAVRRMVAAFEGRAKALYGAPVKPGA